jgi:SAM-dependent methyltransferase
MGSESVASGAAERQQADRARGQAFQLEGQGPEAYERYLVPAFFRDCAHLLVEAAALGPRERVLDLACGTGIVARCAAARIGSGGVVAGVDNNEGMIAVAHSAAADVRPVIAWQHGDAAALPFSDGEFDVVCCQQGFQFFPDQELALGEMRRVLAGAGRLAVAVWRSIEANPVFADLTGSLERHLGPDAAEVLRTPFTAPDPGRLRALLAGCGFADVRIRIGIIPVRFPSVEEFLWQEAVSSPLAGYVTPLDDQGRRALVDDLERVLEPYADDDGIAFPMQTWLVTARRGATSR